MKLYRFSPITDYSKLLEAAEYIHEKCHELCLQSFGTHLPTTGTMALFTHFPEEFQALTKLQQEICGPDDPFNGKYFKLIEPIVFSEDPTTPSATYTHFYIRRPDPYRSQVGDIDFFLPKAEFEAQKQKITNKNPSNMRIFPGNDLDMIELYGPESDVLAYIDTYKLDDKSTWSTT